MYKWSHVSAELALVMSYSSNLNRLANQVRNIITFSLSLVSNRLILPFLNAWILSICPEAMKASNLTSSPSTFFGLLA